MSHTIHDEHPHNHGEGCGHVAFQHGDHTDYAHDCHRHAAHDGHWDDHQTHSPHVNAAPLHSRAALPVLAQSSLDSR